MEERRRRAVDRAPTSARAVTEDLDGRARQEPHLARRPLQRRRHRRRSTRRSINGDEFTLTGAGSESLIATAGNAATRVGDNIWRYTFNGQLGTGKVTVNFLANTWRTAEGNQGTAGSGQFARHHAGASRSSSSSRAASSSRSRTSKLMEAKADVTLEIDRARNAFRLNFNGRCGSSASAPSAPPPAGSCSRRPQRRRHAARFWGVATIETNFSRARAVRHLPVRQGHAADQPHGRDADRDADAAGPRPGRRATSTAPSRCARTPSASRSSASSSCARRAWTPTCSRPRAGSRSTSARRSSSSTSPPRCPSATATRSSTTARRPACSIIQTGVDAGPQRRRRGHAHRQPLRRHRPARTSARCSRSTARSR